MKSLKILFVLFVGAILIFTLFGCPLFEDDYYYDDHYQRPSYQFSEGGVRYELWDFNDFSSETYYVVRFVDNILTTVNILSNIDGIPVKKIGIHAFQNCYLLTSVVIPDSIISIDDNTFTNCVNLISITIPASVMIIGNNVFNGCEKLASVTILNISPPVLGTSTFNNTHPSLLIRVPIGSVDAYKTAPRWSTFSSRIVPIGG